MTSNMLINYTLAILFLPLLSFIILIFVSRRLPRQGDWVAIGSVLITLVLSLAMFGSMLLSNDSGFSYEASIDWMDLGAFLIQLGFLIDNITIVMLLVVALISTMTHVFSIKYMAGDIRYSRYYAYLGLFTFSMNGIILSNNLFSLYIFWELVGVERLGGDPGAPAVASFVAHRRFPADVEACLLYTSPSPRDRG